MQNIFGDYSKEEKKITQDEFFGEFGRVGVVVTDISELERGKYYQIFNKEVGYTAPFIVLNTDKLRDNKSEYATTMGLDTNHDFLLENVGVGKSSSHTCLVAITYKDVEKYISEQQDFIAKGYREQYEDIESHFRRSLKR